ncbi:MAG: hypothetical protein HY378_00325 [Candidatus Brennerbacteria bacterium]|nr:hypothetical protein [Candidatus Brennerbacteria bacterium]
MAITKSQFLALTPGKHLVVDAEGSRLRVISNSLTSSSSDVPGEREVTLQFEDDFSIVLGWDSERGLIVDDEWGEWPLLNSPHSKVVEI